MPRNSTNSAQCRYCREVSVSLDGLRLVNDRSEPTRTEYYFVLPPLMEHYYRQRHYEYVSLPKQSSLNSSAEQTLHIVYPADGSVISLPKQIDGTRGSIVCQAVHTSSAELFWHLDGMFVGTTSDVHKMQIEPSPGYHTITVVDDSGAQETIEVIVK